MNWWRITKYNPENRNTKGVYLGDDWTSFNDVVKSSNNSILSFSQYLAVENLYVNTVKEFMKSVNLEQLLIDDLEKKFIPPNDKYLITSIIDVNSFYIQLKNGMSLKCVALEVTIRLILREFIWAKLKSTMNLEVHFGYDYYMYIGCSKLPENIRSCGLFIESRESPYNT
ncbi:MAG: hypothetical protein LBS21_09030, partial [Clostridiales bacterium]|nr:hypothetical protein [Clostridiales bacterium]